MKHYLFWGVFSFCFLFSRAQVNSAYRPGDDSVFTKVEIDAGFKGGQSQWTTYLGRSLNAIIPFELFAPPGRYTVMVQFIVEKDGTINDITPLTNHGFGMEEEVIRVISKGPNWIPAIQDGKTVRSYKKQPVTFIVDSEFKLSTYKIKASEENVIEIKSEGTKDEDLDATISAGTIRKDSGSKYILKVDQPGRVFVTIWIWINKKKKEMGTVAVDVK